MKKLIDLIKSKHPQIVEIFQPVSSNEELIKKFREINLPDDYYEVYGTINGENDDSDGVFGLHQL